jgi:hypothetical protein
MTKREEPWPVEDDWIAEEERWFKEEGKVYYPWATTRGERWARLVGALSGLPEVLHVTFGQPR